MPTNNSTKVKKLLTEAVTLLCRSSLIFESDVTVEGLLGITLDKKEILLVSINENIQQSISQLETLSDTAQDSAKEEKQYGRGMRKAKRSLAKSEASTNEEEPLMKKNKITQAHKLPLKVESQALSSAQSPYIELEKGFNSEVSSHNVTSPNLSRVKIEKKDDSFPIIQKTTNESHLSGEMINLLRKQSAHSVTCDIAISPQSSSSVPPRGSPADIERRTCKFCKRIYSSHGNLNIHIKTMHMDIRDFECIDCKRKFRQKIQMQTHRCENWNGTKKCRYSEFPGEIDRQLQKKSDHHIPNLVEQDLNVQVVNVLPNPESISNFNSNEVNSKIVNITSDIQEKRLPTLECEEQSLDLSDASKDMVYEDEDVDKHFEAEYEEPSFINSEEGNLKIVCVVSGNTDKSPTPEICNQKSMAAD